jgi:hypothetical protein
MSSLAEITATSNLLVENEQVNIFSLLPLCQCIQDESKLCSLGNHLFVTSKWNSFFGTHDN